MYTSFYKLLTKLNLEEEIAALKKKEKVFSKVEINSALL